MSNAVEQRQMEDVMHRDPLAAVPLFDLGLVGPVDARGTLTLPCGCDVGRDGTIAYALMTCSEKHFSAYCDRKLAVEHTRTHKRRRKGCKFCNGAPLS